MTPDEDYALETLTVGGVDVTDQVADGEYTFTMPGEAVTVRAALCRQGGPRSRCSHRERSVPQHRFF